MILHYLPFAYRIPTYHMKNLVIRIIKYELRWLLFESAMLTINSYWIITGKYLCFQADSVTEGKRVSAFGVLAGVVSGASLCSTFAARLLSTAQIFQVFLELNFLHFTWL